MLFDSIYVRNLAKAKLLYERTNESVSSVDPLIDATKSFTSLKFGLSISRVRLGFHPRCCG